MKESIKKRIFIAMHYMEIGGAEISLIGLLQALNYSKYDVDLFIYSHRGELMQFIPKEVNLLPEIKSYSFLEKKIILTIENGLWGIASARILGKIVAKILNTPLFSNDVLISKLTSFFLPKINPSVEYDLAISFLTPHTYCRDKVNAKKKACWIHTDYSYKKVDVKTEFSVWNAFDYIVAISEDARIAFLKVFPSLKNKIMVMENILSPIFVQSRAEEFEVHFNDNENDNENPDEIKYINLLSVGRFCEAKNYDNVPDICRRINAMLNENEDENEKVFVRWYLIGFGGDEQLIRQKIEEAGMQEHVIILGKRSNPYPYIKACDIYCQPSRYEGKSVTVREAQMLCKPVVVTDYPTAKSQVQDGIDGVIVPMDNERCAKGIAKFIQDEQKQKIIVDYLKSHDYGNVSEANKLNLLLK